MLKINLVVGLLLKCSVHMPNGSQMNIWYTTHINNIIITRFQSTHASIVVVVIITNFIIITQSTQLDGYFI